MNFDILIVEKQAHHLPHAGVPETMIISRDLVENATEGKFRISHEGHYSCLLIQGLSIKND